MTYQTILSADELSELLDSGGAVVVFDCRFRLADPESGRSQFERGHVPGAVYAHLNEDLSGTVVPGLTGRHPLPAAETLRDFLRRAGVHDQSQVIAYDDAGGAFASRLWWMLRWLNHENVAVLDGGWKAWIDYGGKIETGAGRPHVAGSQMQSVFSGEERSDLVIHVDDLVRGGRRPRQDVVLIDARTTARYTGEKEPLDPVAGRIPGAVSRPFAGNLTDRGRFRPPDELRRRFSELIPQAGAATKDVVSYCGSGVTAAHNILATQIAGLPMPRLYAGSWSEWITNPKREVEVG